MAGYGAFREPGTAGVSAESKESFQTAVGGLSGCCQMLFSALGTAFFNFLAARWGLKDWVFSFGSLLYPVVAAWYLSWGIIIGLGWHSWGIMLVLNFYGRR